MMAGPTWVDDKEVDMLDIYDERCDVPWFIEQIMWRRFDMRCWPLDDDWIKDA